VGDAAFWVVGDAKASAEERVAIYARMYRARAAEALASQFPRLAKEVGDADFSALSAAYVAEHPSTHPSLRFLGQGFSAWMEDDDATLAGLARLEWARCEVFDQLDQPVLTLADLRTWPAERFGEMSLALVAAHRLIEAPRGTAALWDAIGADEPLPLRADPCSQGHETLLVWREGIAVFHRVVEEAEASALETVSRGARFAVICEGLLARLPEEAAVTQAFGWLSTWVTDQLIVAPGT